MATDNSVRLDKWLWAARFFKTRSIAKEAISGGKIHCDGVKGKASRPVMVGMSLKIRQGYQEKTVIVKDLSQHRGPAAIAQTLYQETEESIKNRETLSVQRQSMPKTEGKPDKRQRRQIHRFKREHD